MKQLDVLATVLVVVGALNWVSSGLPSSIWSPRFSGCGSARPRR